MKYSPRLPCDLDCSLARCIENVEYCNFILELVVSQSALIRVTSEILTAKGPLPVGEIGKVLAELTSIPNISQKCKEKFGGLKKFLEHFPDQFVISNDHPYNPHVVLRTSVSPEYLDLINRGIFPPQLLAKSKVRGTDKIA